MSLAYHVIVNKSFLDARGIEIRNQVYKMWKTRWEKIYAEQHSTHVPLADDFVRHDLFSVLMSNAEVIAFSAHSFLDTRDVATFDRDYYTMFGDSYTEALEKRQISQLMTFESLVVHPDYSRNMWQLPLGRLLMRINSYLLDTSAAEAMMAVARRDNGVAANLEVVNYEMIEENKDCRGFPCDLKVLPRGPHLAPIQDKVEPHAAELWTKREVHEGNSFFVPAAAPLRRVA